MQVYLWYHFQRIILYFLSPFPRLTYQLTTTGCIPLHLLDPSITLLLRHFRFIGDTHCPIPHLGLPRFQSCKDQTIGILNIVGNILFTEFMLTLLISGHSYFVSYMVCVHLGYVQHLWVGQKVKMLSGQQFSDSSWYFGSIRTKYCQIGNENQKIVLWPTFSSSSWQLSSLAARGKREWKGEEVRIPGVYISLYLRNMHPWRIPKKRGCGLFLVHQLLQLLLYCLLESFYWT